MNNYNFPIPQRIYLVKTNIGKIGDIFEIPPQTEFWSISLQETLYSNKPLYVKVTHVCAGTEEPCFGTLQLKFNNFELQQYIGESAITYVDKANGDIGLDFKKCKKVRENEISKENKI